MDLFLSLLVIIVLLWLLPPVLPGILGQLVYVVLVIAALVIGFRLLQRILGAGGYEDW